MKRAVSSETLQEKEVWLTITIDNHRFGKRDFGRYANDEFLNGSEKYGESEPTNISRFVDRRPQS